MTPVLPADIAAAIVAPSRRSAARPATSSAPHSAASSSATAPSAKPIAKAAGEATTGRAIAIASSTLFCTPRAMSSGATTTATL